MILNIAAYHFVAIAEPAALVERLRMRAQAGDLRGTVLVAEEGVNLFLAGADEAIHGFLDRLREDARFAAMRVKFSRSPAQPFARLKVKRKAEIISFRRNGASPLTGRRRRLPPRCSRAGSSRDATTTASAWCCSIRVTARRSITAALPMR